MMRIAPLLLVSLSACLVGDLDELPQPAPGGSTIGGADNEIPAPIPDDPHQPVATGKHAFILAHGFSGSSDSFDEAIVAAIKADGHAVFRTQVPPIEGVAQRAAALGPQIDQFLAGTGATKVHIIAHSMGGLDARYAISKLGYAGKVASLTTISTPHRGTPLADLALGITESSVASQSDALEAIADLVGVDLDSPALHRALVDLSETQAATFNATVVDAAGVVYESYAGLSTPGGISNSNAEALCTTTTSLTPDPDSTRAALVLAQPIVANGSDRLPNDGVVGVASAKWGGFKGCIAADHLDETSIDGAGTNTPAFYRALAARLAL